MPVKVLRVGGDEGQWVTNGTWPGVVVAAAPLGAIAAVGSEGVVHLRVDAGCRAVVTPSDAPWVVGDPTSDDLDKLQLGRAEGVSAARQRARDSDEAVGWVRDEFMEPVLLSVRLTHRCGHQPADWSRKACGHVYCARCNGWVHPGTRVAAPSAGAVLLCNRKPQGIQDYTLWFGEVGVRGSASTKAM